jgi:hypothetical protein
MFQQDTTLTPSALLLTLSVMTDTYVLKEQLLRLPPSAQLESTFYSLLGELSSVEIAPLDITVPQPKLNPLNVQQAIIVAQDQSTQLNVTEDTSNQTQA